MFVCTGMLVGSVGAVTLAAVTGCGCAGGVVGCVCVVG